MATYLMATNGNDGTFWALNAAHQALRYLGNSSVQPETSQALTYIAVGNVNSIYGLSAAGEVYRLVNTPYQAAPWTPMWHVSTSADGSAWGVDGNGNIFEWSGGQWQQRPNGGAMALFVAVGDGGNVWTIDNTSGWWGGPGVPYKWNGSTFAPVTDAPNAQWISIAPDGTVWLQSHDDRTLYLDGGVWRVAATNTPNLFGIAAGNGGLVYGWDFGLLWVLGGGFWQPIDTLGSCASAGVAADGTLLVDGDPVVRLAGFGAWQSLVFPNRTLDKIAIDAHKMYALDVQTGVYLQWGGSTWQKIAGSNFVSISAGVDGSLWAVDQAQAIWSFDGAAWQSVPGRMQKVAVGSSQYIAGLDPSGKLFFFTGGGWQAVSSPTTGAMLDVAIGADASLFAIDGNHHLWSRIAPGDWSQAGTMQLQQIDAADRYHVCGVTWDDGSGQNAVWSGSGVAVGADHHLHHYFKSPLWQQRQQSQQGRQDQQAQTSL
ncbi:tectonin domain-containing protein [Lysobacter sp. Root916]|uniref:tectonin domain-containing protein n=1 Tax=Lysobacter sp. Root916 TaxID=1736606 RepID=UPI000B20046F|nr:tectonin domain-containing protein [Lysobacter sp. Root916]